MCQTVWNVRGKLFGFRLVILVKNPHKTTSQMTSTANSRFGCSWCKSRWFSSKITPPTCSKARLDQFRYLQSSSMITMLLGCWKPSSYSEPIEGFPTSPTCLPQAAIDLTPPKWQEGRKNQILLRSCYELRNSAVRSIAGHPPLLQSAGNIFFWQ